MHYLYSLGISAVIVGFVFYAGRRYERIEWELVDWENAKLRTDNANLRDKQKSDAQDKARLKQQLLAKHLIELRRNNLC